MHTIELSSETFKQLQSLAKPLVDTPETVIRRLLRLDKGDIGPPPVKQVTVYPPENIPPLKHAKLCQGNFDGALPGRKNWNSLLKLALMKVMEKYSSVDDLRKISEVNVCFGRKENEGYSYVQSQNFSYQLVNASNAASIVMRCAKNLGCEASFEFEWRNKEGAHKPGERGIVSIND